MQILSAMIDDKYLNRIHLPVKLTFFHTYFIYFDHFWYKSAHDTTFQV